jgi:hypothetical protein
MSARANRYLDIPRYAADRYKADKVYPELATTHHRLPRSIGGNSDDSNLSELPCSCHRAWHVLFQNWTAERIAHEINARYLDPAYKMIVVPAHFVKH